MNPFMRTPSFTASHPGLSIHHAHSDASPVAQVAPSHPVAGVKASRPILHLPAGKPGVTRRSWPFLNPLSSLDSLNALESLSLLNR